MAHGMGGARRKPARSGRPERFSHHKSYQKPDSLRSPMQIKNVRPRSFVNQIRFVRRADFQ